MKNNYDCIYCQPYQFPGGKLSNRCLLENNTFFTKFCRHNETIGGCKNYRNLPLEDVIIPDYPPLVKGIISGLFLIVLSIVVYVLYFL